jgi:PAS domain S-box-containing protein
MRPPVEWTWETDTSHRFTYSSETVRELLGCLPEELLGRATSSLLAVDEVDRVGRIMSEGLAANSGWDNVDVVWRHVDGSPVLLRESATTVLDADGNAVGLRGVRRLLNASTFVERSVVAARQRVQAVLEGGTVDIALQPIVDVTSGRVAGVESLARFPDGRDPEQWFRDARDTGLGLDLDRLCFMSALHLFDQVPSSVYLSINASPELITAGLSLADLLSAQVPLDRLVIEITEHVQIADYQELHEALAPLREQGVRLAIDDTGAGYASFAHVLQLRPHIVKIDRSLIANVGQDAARRSLVTALVLLALDLGASVTGEGVERPAELDALASLGVDHVQGFLLGRPRVEHTAWSRWWRRNWLVGAPRSRALAAG